MLDLEIDHREIVVRNLAISITGSPCPTNSIMVYPSPLRGIFDIDEPADFAEAMRPFRSKGN